MFASYCYAFIISSPGWLSLFKSTKPVKPGWAHSLPVKDFEVKLLFVLWKKKILNLCYFRTQNETETVAILKFSRRRNFFVNILYSLKIKSSAERCARNFVKREQKVFLCPTYCPRNTDIFPALVSPNKSAIMSLLKSTSAGWSVKLPGSSVMLLNSSLLAVP